MENRLLVRGGDVVDGTGAPSLRADVRVRDGRIVEVGANLAPDGEPELDASGALVTPGFIDTHAHTDPQVFWDPSLDPEPLHGVTTMLVGNCSLSLCRCTRTRICCPVWLRNVTGMSAFSAVSVIVLSTAGTCRRFTN